MDNFCARILDAASRFPDRPAIEKVRADGLETNTYRNLMDDAGRFAAWLVRAGLVPGDRAAILADNDASWIAAYLGTLWMGGVSVPLDTAYKAAQVRTILEHSGAKVLFTIPRYLDLARAAVDPLGGAAPQLVLLTGSSAGLADAASVRMAAPAPPIFQEFELRNSNFALRQAQGVPSESRDELPQGSAVILYTSGTTADPKGVVLSHANLDAERLAAFAVVDVTEHDAVLGVLPLFHALAQMANLLLPLSVGARVVFLETVNSSTLLEALQTQGITIFACVPQFFYLIHQRVTAEVARGGSVARVVFRALLGTNGWLRDTLRWNPGHRWFGRVHRQLGPQMRLLITGGSKFDPAISRDLHALGFTLLNAYGLTETSGGAAMMRPGDGYTTSVGHPFPGVEIKIDLGCRFPAVDEALAADPEGNRHPRSILSPDGEILIRGPIVMREYFRRPDATSEALDADGWLHTGDLGRLDADGRLYITGRLKEIIVLSSGKNLYPEEIEAHYRQSTVIKELCVLGHARPDEPAAERLHAVIVPDEDALRARGVVNIGDLIRFEVETASASLPAHKRVLSYDISLEPLPRTTTGKLRRHEILRSVHERAAAKTADVARPLTDTERHWLEAPAHQTAVDAVAAQLGRPGLRPDANLDLDLGLDSMERVELLTMLERRAGTKVTPEVRATIFTLRQLVDAVIAGAPGEQAASAGADPRSELPWATILAEPPDAALEADLRRSKFFVALGFFVILRVAALLARLTPGFRIAGRPQWPQQGPFIICPNHQSHLDGFFLAAALPFRSLRQLFFVGAAEYFQTPLMKRLARLINIVPVDPDANLITAMQAGSTGLRLKKILILFPEGERTIDGELKRFRKGAAILASHLGAPIVPVAIDGLYPLWPRGRGFQWRGLMPGRSKRISVTFGEAVDVKAGEYSEGTETLRAGVARLLS
jgi:long-chain acyl-CoA synthetase